MAQKHQQDGGGQGQGSAPKGSDAAARLQAERAANKAGETHRNDMHARKEAMATKRQAVADALARIDRRERKEAAAASDQSEEKGSRWWSWLRRGKGAGDKEAEKKAPAGAVKTQNLTMPDSEADTAGPGRIAIDADTASPPRHDAGAGNSPAQGAPTHPKPRVAAEPDPAINPMEELREQELLDKCRFELAHGEPGKAILVVTLRGEITSMDRDDIVNELRPYGVVDEKQRLVIEGDDTIARVASDLLKAKKDLHHAKGFEMPESLAKALRGHGIKWTQRAAGQSAHGGQTPSTPAL